MENHIKEGTIILSDSNSGSMFGNAYLFTSRRQDDKTGLYYYRNRYYEPLSGRFISRDPLHYEEAPNLYSYALNEPMNLVDPKGLKGKKKRSCKEGPKITAPETILTYVSNLKNAKGRTSVHYNVFVCCLCENRAKKVWKLKVFVDVHYLIKIEKKFRGTRQGPLIYGHELQHVAALKQAIKNSASLRQEIRKQQRVNYSYFEGCSDNLDNARLKVLNKLLEAIKTGAGHDIDSNTTKPAEGEEINPGKAVQSPPSKAELRKIKRKLKGYHTYDPR